MLWKKRFHIPLNDCICFRSLNTPCIFPMFIVYLVLRCPKANSGTPLRRQPHSSDVNPHMFSYLDQRLLGASKWDFVPTTQQCPQWGLSLHTSILIYHQNPMSYSPCITRATTTNTTVPNSTLYISLALLKIFLTAPKLLNISVTTGKSLQYLNFFTLVKIAHHMRILPKNT